MQKMVAQNLESQDMITPLQQRPETSTIPPLQRPSMLPKMELQFNFLPVLSVNKLRHGQVILLTVRKSQSPLQVQKTLLQYLPEDSSLVMTIEAVAKKQSLSRALNLQAKVYLLQISKMLLLKETSLKTLQIMFPHRALQMKMRFLLLAKMWCLLSRTMLLQLQHLPASTFATQTLITIQ